MAFVYPLFAGKPLPSLGWRIWWHAWWDSVFGHLIGTTTGHILSFWGTVKDLTCSFVRLIFHLRKLTSVFANNLGIFVAFSQWSVLKLTLLLFVCSAHVKASMMGSSLTIPITAGRFKLGIWQVYMRSWYICILVYGIYVQQFHKTLISTHL